VTDETRAEMRRILAEVRSGEFTRRFVAEAEAGHPRMTEWSRRGEEHSIESARAAVVGLKGGS
jgi:ketol-acid reductoisomerase